MNSRLQLRLLKKPDPKPSAPKPVYPRVPLHGGYVVDRRADFYRRWDAHHGELRRLASFEQSAATRNSP